MEREGNALPSVPDMIQNLIFSAINVTKAALKTGQVVAGQETIEKRIRTCKGCRFLINQKRCKLCGCFVVAKAGLQAEKCPDNKW
jgi:predicted Zn-ribbon and HTH transcriptional regulator